MSIAELNLQGLRNLSSSKFVLHPHLNLIYGANGSGKTSFLEAFYLLSSGHSFRTREILPLITHGQNSLTVFARMDDEQTVSVQKNLNGPTLVRLNQQPCYSCSDLARFLPCQVFHHDLFQVIEAGPSVRRAMLDWGLFHVEPSYHGLWKNYRHVLKQRNALLRQAAPRSHFIPWDQQLFELAMALEALRSDYFQAWNVLFQQILAQLYDGVCELSYFKGWDKRGSGSSLLTILADQFDQDLQRQYTYSGAHQADVYFLQESGKAKLSLSRGQQKIVLIALKLAQVALLKRPCLYLFDDLTAELDAVHLDRLIQFLTKINGQFIVTALDERPFKPFLEMPHHIFRLSEGKILS